MSSKNRVSKLLDRLFETSPPSRARSEERRGFETKIVRLEDSSTGKTVNVSKDVQFHFMCKSQDVADQYYVTGLVDACSISRVESNGSVTHLRLSLPKGEEKIDPHGIVLSGTGKRLYFADSRHHVIRCVDLTTMKTRIMVGAFGEKGKVDGSRVDARMKYPCELVICPTRNAMYVADSYNYCIRRVDLKDGTVGTYSFLAKRSRTFHSYNCRQNNETNKHRNDCWG